MKASASVQTVILPNGQRVEVSKSVQEWWARDGAAGFIDPQLLAPDPKQPRKYMIPLKLAELQASVAERGVRDSITVTPRHLAPWAKVLAEHEHCPFLIVSGHRRAHAALNVQLAAVPIEVRVYPNEREHRSDVSLLNKGQDPLTELEEGFEILSLKESGWTFAQLSAHYGWTPLTIQYRINLTKLHPNLQALISPEVPERERKLQVSTAYHLGAVGSLDVEELTAVAQRFAMKLDDADVADPDARRFALQRILYDVIKLRNLNTSRATKLIKDLTVEFPSGRSEHGRRARWHEPNRRRDVLETLHKSVQGSVVVDWTPDEFRRVLANVSREDADNLLRELEAARSTLEGVIRHVRTIAQGKRATNPEVVAIMQRRYGGKVKAS